ncbi:MAG: hypothetical protein IPP37_16945 [Saprospiraceae bacterium]|nr:hypothetical protein [Saprospiraceae bacterium]
MTAQKPQKHYLYDNNTNEHSTKHGGFLHYSLREGSAEGELIEETFGQEPLTFIFGNGQMISGFEANLNGKLAGDTYSFC